MKLKLKSSAKIKKRYLLIKGKKTDVEKAILDYLGILGWAKASPVFLKSEKTDTVLLSVDRSALIEVRAAFALVSGIKILRVSGTIKGLSK